MHGKKKCRKLVEEDKYFLLILKAPDVRQGLFLFTKSVVHFDENSSIRVVFQEKTLKNCIENQNS